MSIFQAHHAVVAAIGLAMLAADASDVRADHAPVFVVPGRPGVPVVLNGRDASWAVVEGDWGLSRPGHMPITIIGGGGPVPPRGYNYHQPYFPSYGAPPPRGRNEIEPPPDRALPPPAETFSRVWSTQSDPVPADVPSSRAYQANPDPDAPPPGAADAQPLMPGIVVVPQRRLRR